MTDTAWIYQHEPRFEAISDAVADAASGTGETTLLDVGPAPYHHYAYFDCDVDATGINYGNGERYTVDRYGYSIDVVECNADQEVWPIDDNPVDIVLMGAILEHLFDPLHALDEARRVGDQLVLSTPNAVRLIQRVRAIAGRNPFDGFSKNHYDRHQHEWTYSELEDICNVAGWDIVSEQRVCLNRPGKGRTLQYLSSVHRGLADQIVIRCEAAEPQDRAPNVYRQALTDREVYGDIMPSLQDING